MIQHGAPPSDEWIHRILRLDASEGRTEDVARLTANLAAGMCCLRCPLRIVTDSQPETRSLSPTTTHSSPHSSPQQAHNLARRSHIFVHSNAKPNLYPKNLMTWSYDILLNLR